MARRLLIALPLLILPALAGAEEFLYVLSAKAKLYSAPRFDAPVVSVLTKGEKTRELEKNRYWFKVRHGDREGWISRLAVSPHPPVKKASLLARDEDTLQHHARRRASTASTTAAVRGLREDRRTRANESGAPDFAALQRMESLQVSDDEVADFAQALYHRPGSERP